MLCLQGLDEYHMNYIGLCDVEANCYKVFVNACEAGLEQVRATGDIVIDRRLGGDDISAIIFSLE